MYLSLGRPSSSERGPQLLSVSPRSLAAAMLMYSSAVSVGCDRRTPLVSGTSSSYRLLAASASVTLLPESVRQGILTTACALAVVLVDRDLARYEDLHHRYPLAEALRSPEGRDGPLIDLRVNARARVELHHGVFVPWDDGHASYVRHWPSHHPAAPLQGRFPTALNSQGRVQLREVAGAVDQCPVPVNAGKPVDPAEKVRVRITGERLHLPQPPLLMLW